MFHMESHLIKFIYIVYLIKSWFKFILIDSILCVALSPRCIWNSMVLRFAKLCSRAACRIFVCVIRDFALHFDLLLCARMCFGENVRSQSYSWGPFACAIESGTHCNKNSNVWSTATTTSLRTIYHNRFIIAIIYYNRFIIAIIYYNRCIIAIIYHNRCIIIRYTICFFFI